MSETTARSTYTRAILLVIGEAFCFSLMAFCVRMAGTIPTMQKAFFRNLIAVFVVLPQILRHPEGLRLSRGAWLPLLVRCAFGFGGVVLNFWAVDHLPLADASILNKLSPFVAMVMSVFVLKEKPTKAQWFFVLLAFTGAIFVVKPTGTAGAGSLVGLMSGICAGTAYTYVRKLGQYGMKGTPIVFYFSVFSTLLLLPTVLFSYEPMSAVQWLWLLGAGAFAALGQLGITKAYGLVPAKRISVFDYTQIMFAGLWGLLFFGELPDHMSLVGYTLIISAAVLLWRNSRREQGG